MRFRSTLFALALLLAQHSSADEESDNAEAALNRDWQIAAKSAGLSLKAMQQLGKEKVIMTNDELFQCFEAYLPSERNEHPNSDKTELPYFITSDALFHAYCWCVQKSVGTLEQLHAEQTEEYLEALIKSLHQLDDRITGAPAIILAAKERAMFVIGVAAQLMDLKPQLPASIESEVEHEVARIRLALGTGTPKRLGLAPSQFSNLDYTLFKPVSFYASDPILSGYFRAVRWLQLIPFRLSSDEDMLAAKMIEIAQEYGQLKALKIDPKVAQLWTDRERKLESLAGPCGHQTIINGGFLDTSDDRERASVEEWIGRAREDYSRSQTPDPSSEKETAITSTLQAAAESEVCAYMASSSSLADALLIENLSRAQGQTYFPNALSVASWLGSSYAADLEKADAPTSKAREDAQRLIDGSQRYPALHSETLRVLKRLFEPMPPDAPTFMKTKSWQVKSCQTALAGWAQARHMWALQARPQYSVGAGVTEWPAFIEPLPDFFSGLAGLARKASSLFGQSQQGHGSSRIIARKLRAMANEYENYKGKNATSQERRLTIHDILYDAGASSSKDHFANPEGILEFSRILRQSADHIERGEADSQHPIAQNLNNQLSTRVVAPFDELEKTCLQLASLAHKQLRGLSPREEEADWLLIIGARLSTFSDCHFESPKDNVPKAVRVFTNTSLEKALTIGIGRPTFLYVLYPWKGKEILCRGAVLPYLERTEMKSFTDHEWHSQLNHPTHPPTRPDWMRPLIAE